MEKILYFFKSTAVKVIATAPSSHSAANNPQPMAGYRGAKAHKTMGVYVPAIST